MPRIPHSATAQRRMVNQQKEGAVLFVLMVFMAALTLYAATAYLTSSLDIRTARSHILATRALYQADAGVRHVSERVREDVRSGSLRLNSMTHAVSYPAPAELTFDTVTALYRLADETSYSFEVVGRSAEASATIEAILSIDDKLRFGLFADRNMTFGPTARVYSYNSSQILNPNAGDSTHDSLVGVNGSMGGNSATVNGTILLGENLSGQPASYSHEFSSTQAAVVERTTHIDPDPLGVVGGELAADFARVAAANDNATAVGGVISGNSISLQGDVTLRAGDYYVSQINIGNHRTLRVDATDGPVNIYLTGTAYVAPNASIDTGPPLPNNLRIYANSSAKIDFAPNARFVGFIYAPLATIDIKPNASVYGALWGRDLNISPNGDIFTDNDLFRSMFQTSLVLHSWKQVLD